jgi:hypothetical protein
MNSNLMRFCTILSAFCFKIKNKAGNITLKKRSAEILKTALPAFLRTFRASIFLNIFSIRIMSRTKIAEMNITRI